MDIYHTLSCILYTVIYTVLGIDCKCHGHLSQVILNIALHPQVFEGLLLDGDWALNAGNWLWLSASAFFHQYFRVYSPIAFGKKTDKHGEYIK